MRNSHVTFNANELFFCQSPTQFLCKTEKQEHWDGLLQDGFLEGLVSVSSPVTKQIDGSDRLVMSLWCQYSCLPCTCLLVWNTLCGPVIEEARQFCMQKPVMAVTGDETGKNFKEGFKFCRFFFFFWSLEELFRGLWVFQKVLIF